MVAAKAKLIVPVRLEPEVVARIDRLATRLSRRASGLPVVRSEALRLALARGLDAIEKEEGRRGK